MTDDAESRKRELEAAVRALYTEGHISAEQILEWMKSSDLEIQAIVCELLFDSARMKRVSPRLAFVDYRDFILQYLRQCIFKNPDSEHAESRWEACSTFANWFRLIWQDEELRRIAAPAAKNFASEMCTQSDPEIRRTMIQAALEHMFENPDVRVFFADWATEPALREAFDAASEWSLKGGHSPLWVNR